MSYCEAMEAAGATVHQYEEFGSYQGDWYAKVTYKGETGWVHGWYGSCSGCDSFQAEFDYNSNYCNDHKYSYDEKFKSTCSACIEQGNNYNKRLAEFGENYLMQLMTQEEAEKDVSSYDEGQLKFLKENSLDKV